MFTYPDAKKSWDRFLKFWPGAILGAGEWSKQCKNDYLCQFLEFRSLTFFYFLHEPLWIQATLYGVPFFLGKLWYGPPGGEGGSRHSQFFKKKFLKNFFSLIFYKMKKLIKKNFFPLCNQNLYSSQCKWLHIWWSNFSQGRHT